MTSKKRTEGDGNQEGREVETWRRVGSRQEGIRKGYELGENITEKSWEVKAESGEGTRKPWGNRR